MSEDTSFDYIQSGGKLRILNNAQFDENPRELQVRTIEDLQSLLRDNARRIEVLERAGSPRTIGSSGSSAGRVELIVTRTEDGHLTGHRPPEPVTPEEQSFYDSVIVDKEKGTVRGIR